MYFDNHLIKRLFGIHETQLRRYREEGLRSKLVEVFTNGMTTSRRLYSAADLAKHLRNVKSLPKGLRVAAQYDYADLMTVRDDDDDEPPPVPNTPEGRAFILAWLAGYQDLAGWLDIAPEHATRLFENVRGIPRQ